MMQWCMNNLSSFDYFYMSTIALLIIRGIVAYFDVLISNIHLQSHFTIPLNRFLFPSSSVQPLIREYSVAQLLQIENRLTPIRRAQQHHAENSLSISHYIYSKSMAKALNYIIRIRFK